MLKLAAILENGGGGGDISNFWCLPDFTSTALGTFLMTSASFGLRLNRKKAASATLRDAMYSVLEQAESPQLFRGMLARPSRRLTVSASDRIKGLSMPKQ